MKTKKGVYLEPALLEQAKKQAKHEHRNFSNFVEVVIIKYLENKGA